ncbi:hypothetical protein D9613_006468 [Agrocybe pediades]|uniref:F-box domain-containing protein n=1 Tax=Agrocybe pediades TaxID=84607 RepID=A0A8H4VIG5_9AGAR|nr:hypothetical protein D9613_006468 [Agrocybe pediades]
MVHLPPEIIHMIIEEVEDHSTLQLCRLIDRTFLDIVNELAFESLVTRKEIINTSESSLENLSAHKNIAKNVRIFYYDARGVVVPEVKEEGSPLTESSTDSGHSEVEEDDAAEHQQEELSFSESEMEDEENDGPFYEDQEAIHFFEPEIGGDESGLEQESLDYSEPEMEDESDDNDQVPRRTFPPRGKKGREETCDAQVADSFVESMVTDFKFLHRFINLRSLSLFLPWDRNRFNRVYYEAYYEVPPYCALDVRLQEAILDGCAALGTQFKRQGTLLRNFQLHNMLAYPSKALESEGLRSLVKTLTTFAISLYPREDAIDDKEEEPETSASMRFLPKIVGLMATMENLETFIYCHDVGTAGVDERWRLFKSLYFPRLKCLQFEGIAFDYMGEAATDFILRHKATLEELCMDKCVIRDVGTFGWDDVFVEIRDAGMERLSEFTFVPPPGPDEEGRLYHGYGWSSASGELQTIHASSLQYDDADVARDLDALKSLQESISHRRNLNSSI